MVAVIYPEVREPYLGIFQEIIRGIEAELKQPAKPYVIQEGEDTPAAMAARLKAEQIDVAICLGQAGFMAAKTLSEALPVVVGAAFVSPNQETHGLAGISLTPDPEVLFSWLRKLVPEAREVTVIYDPKQKAWEIKQAQHAAGELGLTLNALQAEDLRRSALLFRDVLVEIKSDSVSIWLPENNAVMDSTALLPMVLKEAWDKQFVVFSSSIDHVRKGALFSLYPDNFSMGRSLAVMARNQAQTPSSRSTATIQPLRDLFIAVNLRTAEHLGLDLASNAKHKFDLTFPRPQ